MKCPKCQYLGFETGDRCKNCGYDFSLIEFRSPVDIDIRPGAGEPSVTPLASWDRFDTPRDIAPQPDAPLHDSTAERSTESALPLFALNAEDQPLVRLPVTPRRPLAVRRTPENPRLRTVPKAMPPIEPELDFPEEASLQPVTAGPILLMDPAPMANEPAIGRIEVAPRHERLAGRIDLIEQTSSGSTGETSSARRRCIAAVIDYALLLGIDVAIVYFTVRMAGLDIASWRMLPIVPLAVFLAVIALSYVGVFTAIGGQTIGKMAARIRVVPDEPEPASALHALRRTAAVMVSWLTGGLGFLTVLVGDHRALHDRLSRTRVVNLEA